jgi:hypothetical protein
MNCLIVRRQFIAMNGGPAANATAHCRSEPKFVPERSTGRQAALCLNHENSICAHEIQIQGLFRAGEWKVHAREDPTETERERLPSRPISLWGVRAGPRRPSGSQARRSPCASRQGEHISNAHPRTHRERNKSGGSHRELQEALADLRGERGWGGGEGQSAIRKPSEMF